MSSLACPLCSAAVRASSLEAHLRLELKYPALVCLLCPVRFTDPADATDHFQGLFPNHPSQETQLLRLPKDEGKERRLEELVRLARGGREAVEERLCVCGHCRLACREGETEGRHEAPRLKHRAPVEEPEAQASAAKPPMPASPTVKDRPSVAEAPSGQAPRQPPPHDDLLPYEASEGPAAAEDVKPSLKELKPQLSSDGKVACLICGHRVSKDSFKSHAVHAHSKARPYSCLLCPEATKIKGELTRHQKRDHQTQTTPDTFTFLGSEAEERELLERCFGAAKDIDYLRRRCKPCDRLINKVHMNVHVATVHLKKPLYACRLCDYSSVRQDHTKDHLKRVHKRRPDQQHIDSSAAQHYAPIIKSMAAQLFENPAT